MSSNIQIQRICVHCGSEFIARTTITRFCSHKCSSGSHKKRVRDAKIEASNKETHQIKTQPIVELKAKEFLTVREVAKLLNCSLRSAYYNISSGNIKAVNLGQRITRVKRSEIDKLFELQQPSAILDKLAKELNEQAKQFEISDCYSIADIKSKYGISETGIYELIRRKSIPKLKKGWYTYVPKIFIDKYLS